MLSFECIKNEKSVYFLLTSAHSTLLCWKIGIKTEKQFYYFFALSSNSNMYLSKSDMNNLS